MSYRTHAHPELGDPMWELHATERELEQLRQERDAAIAERDRARALAVMLEQQLAWRIPTYMRNPGDAAERMSVIGFTLHDGAGSGVAV